MDTVAAAGLEGTAVDEHTKEAGGRESVEKKKIKRKKKALLINLTHCRYDSVRRVARRCGLQPVVGEGEDWTVYWVDTSVMMERVMDMKRYQKINHFPGMGEICRKDLLGRNLTRMRKLFPKEYNIFPRTWVMPADYSDFQAFCRVKKNKTFISKPESGCQGKGIVVFKNPKEVKPGDHCVVQQYISKPFIMDGFKFDLRIYVLVTSCDPLRVYVYKDGLGRFATIKYHEPTHHNLNEVCLHLTNYSINKSSDDFIRDDICGSKRRLSTVDQWFIDHGYDIKKIWSAIEDVIIKTLVSAHTILRHNYRSCFPSHNHGSACFEILGFDVLLDHKLKPWIIEVNHSPSFHTDSPLDKEVKEGLLYDTFQLIDLYATDKKRCQEEDKQRAQQRLLTRHKPKEASCKEEKERERYAVHLETYEKQHMGGFRRIYPLEGTEEDPYTKFFEQSSSLCAETAASKARIELARMQRQEIEQKVKEEDRLRKKLAPGVTSGERREQEGEEGEGEGGQEELGRKLRAPLTAVRRVPFRLTAHQRRKKTNEQEKPATEQSETMPTESTIPVGEEVGPQPIDEGEELQRLAGLQLRDRLIRGLDLPQTLTSLLASPQSPPPLPTSLLSPSAPTAHSSTQQPNHAPHPTHTLLPPRRHTSTYCSHKPHLPLLSSTSIGHHPLHMAISRPSSLPGPTETFGLLVSAAPVACRNKQLQRLHTRTQYQKCVHASRLPHSLPSPHQLQPLASQEQHFRL